MESAKKKIEQKKSVVLRRLSTMNMRGSTELLNSYSEDINKSKIEFSLENID